MNFLLTITLAILLSSLHACNTSESDQNATNATGTSASEELLDLAAAGDLMALNQLLSTQRPPDVRDSCNWTPLMKAALYGHTPVMARLLDAGAKVDAVDKGGYIAMMLAASNNHATAVELLLQRRAMVDHQESTEGCIKTSC